MRNLPFVIWTIGFPLGVVIEDYLSYLKGERFSSTIEVIAALIVFVIWICVGTLLFEKKQ